MQLNSKQKVANELPQFNNVQPVACLLIMHADLYAVADPEIALQK